MTSNIPKLYYALFSPPARSCMIVAKLIGLELDLKFVDFSKKEHMSEEFLKINPQHTIPVLIDEGQVIWDSHAINAYLVDKYAKNDKLYPKNLMDRAQVNQRMFFQATTLFSIIKDIVNRVMYGDETEYHEQTIQKAHNAYAFLEKYLEKNDFIAGSELTLGDISIHPTLITLHKSIPVESAKYPRVIQWIDRLNRIFPSNEIINEAGAQELYEKIHLSLQENRKRAI